MRIILGGIFINVSKRISGSETGTVGSKIGISNVFLIYLSSFRISVQVCLATKPLITFYFVADPVSLSTCLTE